MKTPTRAIVAAGALIFSTAAVAGEIKGPPPSANYTAPELDIHSRSICVFSGLNDSPLGDEEVGDPGGMTQSFGSFFASSGAHGFDPRSPSPSPGWSCNPNRGADLHGD